MANISRLDLNLFVVFDAIYTEGGITRASEILNLTQPAVSHALARLRDVVKDPLFVREGNVMTPTPLARELIGPIRSSLHGIRNALHGLDTFDPATSRKRFKIGLRQILESATLPALATRVAGQAPQVDVISVHHEREALQTLLASGEIDIAIDVLLPKTQNIAFRRLTGGGLVVAARAGHPAVRGGLDLDTYLAQDHILATSGNSQRGLEDSALERLGLRRRIRMRCQQYWTASQIVAATDMLLTMPRHYAEAVNKPLGNQILPTPFASPAAHLYLYWHAGVESDPANRWLREQVVAHFAEKYGVGGEEAKQA